jgi:hypothetical protein
VRQELINDEHHHIRESVQRHRVKQRAVVPVQPRRGRMHSHEIDYKRQGL